MNTYAEMLEQCRNRTAAFEQICERVHPVDLYRFDHSEPWDLQQQMPQQMYAVRQQNQAQMQGIQQHPQAGGPSAQQGANTAQVMQTNAAAASGQYMQQGQPQYIMTGMAHRPFDQQSVYHQPTTPPYYSSPPQQEGMRRKFQKSSEENKKTESTMWGFADYALAAVCVIGLGGSLAYLYNMYNKKRDIPAARIPAAIPAKPKRPLTSFFQFASEQRPNIVAMYPNMSITDVSKRLGEMWRDMPVHQKDIYKRGFKARREKYVQEMQSYRSRFTKEELASMDEQEREKKQKKAKRRRKSALKKLNKPKGPPNGYCLCIKDYFDLKNEGGRTEYQFEEAVAVWNSLPEDNKLEYNEKASLLMNIYREEMEEWLREMEEKGIKI